MGILEWKNDFPKGYGHTSISYLKRCIGFNDAKNGDMNSAQFVVSRCVKQKRISELREKYPYAVLLPVLCKNKLPLALAQEIGLPICYSVLLKSAVSRKDMSAMQRLLHIPTFIGFIQKDIDYILVEDVIAQGGTVAALRKFVLSNGGNVVAVVALAYSIGSHNMAPIKRHIVYFMLKFGESLLLILQMAGVVSTVTVYELTNSQIRYLLRFSSVGNIEKKMLQLAC